MNCRMYGFAWALAMALSCGCSESGGAGGGGQACVPGAQVACACSGGPDGVQSCKVDGSGYSFCTCNDAAAGTGGSVADADVPDTSSGGVGGSGTAGVGGGTGGDTGGSSGTGGTLSGGAGGVAGFGGDGGTGGSSTGGAGGAGGAGGSGGSSTGGTGGTGGAGGTGAGGSGGAPTCGVACGAHESCFAPLQICVASMVTTPAGFSIDSTEVTRGQYAAWLATGPSASSQPPSCSWNTSFEPGTDPSCHLNDAPDAPVTCIDWCDANSFCRGVGKRLCGHVGGGPADYANPNDPQGQWYSACSNGTMTGCVLATTQPASVASSPTCQTADGEFDPVGNVQEWVDSCDDYNQCRYRGGSYSATMAASCESYNKAGRGLQLYNIGFRCCSDP